MYRGKDIKPDPGKNKVNGLEKSYQWHSSKHPSIDGQTPNDDRL